MEEAPPNGQHELLGDLPIIEINLNNTSLRHALQTKINDCIVTAAGVIVCVVNATTLVVCSVNGQELVRKETVSDHNSCQQIMVIERTSRGNVVVTGGGNTVCFWSART